MRKYTVKYLVRTKPKLILLLYICRFVERETWHSNSKKICWNILKGKKELPARGENLLQRLHYNDRGHKTIKKGYVINLYNIYCLGYP